MQNYIKNEQQRLTARLEQLRTLISQLPHGDLLCFRNGTRFKWFLSNGCNPIYLPKKETSLAQLLALKKYYKLQEKEITNQLKLVNNYLTAYQEFPLKSNELLAQDSPYYSLLSPHFQTDTDSQAWARADYKHNENYPENLIHKCFSGHSVRSKSEVIIANALYSNHIPYRYECELYLNNVSLFPDFTIRNPRTNETLYWEHFGLMDTSSYREKTYNKLRIYGDNGIIPTINLITTYETLMHPIDSERVQKLIDEHLR